MKFFKNWHPCSHFYTWSTVDSQTFKKKKKKQIMQILKPNLILTSYSTGLKSKNSYI